MNDLKYWIALTDVPDIGPVTARKLIAVYKTPEAVFQAPFKELAGISFIKSKKAKQIKEYDRWEQTDAQIKKLISRNIRAIPFTDIEYPEMLKNISDAPLILYANGTICKDDRFAIAVVGSRKPSPYGRAVTENLSSELTSMGFTIVSGMARGIDTAAHISALKAGGRSIAVLGSGIDVTYPPENKNLMEKISLSGCALSEFPVGTPPERENFPRRNRLISGLSLGVLVVEATADSGSLITAQYAVDQGKEVFAVPGNINSLNSSGTNALIKQGAKLVQKTEDILEELAPVLKGFIKTKTNLNIALADDEKQVCDIMTAEPVHVDVISRESRMPASKVLGILLGLELKGIVRQTEGKKFFLV